MPMCRLPAWLARATARVLVVALAASSAAPLAHTVDRHDPDCSPALVVHDASQHRIVDGADRPDRVPEHCAACHLARSFSVPVLEVSGTPERGVGALLTQRTASARPASLDLRVPARAPPASVQSHSSLE